MSRRSYSVHSRVSTWSEKTGHFSNFGNDFDPEGSVMDDNRSDYGDRVVDFFEEDAPEVEHLYNIYDFQNLMRKRSFELDGIWNELKIHPLSRSEFETKLHLNVLKSLFNRVESNVMLSGALKHLMKGDAFVLKRLLCCSNENPILEALAMLKQTRKIDQDGLNILLSIQKDKRITKYLELKGNRIISSRAKQLAAELHNLFESVSAQLQLPAGAFFRRNKKLRKSLSSWREKQIGIRAIEEKIDENRELYNIQIKQINAEIAEVRQKIDILLADKIAQIKYRVRNSEKTMTAQSLISGIRQEYLQEESKEAIEKLDALLLSNLANEKILRAKRYKIESQLTNWLSKYDAMMMAKQEQFDELDDNFERERLDLIELRCLYTEQKRIYMEYYEQKTAEESEQFWRRVYEFRANRAAKIIQRCWRGYRKRKLARRAAKRERAKARALKKGKRL